jgi:hypothetical protein
MPCAITELTMSDYGQPLMTPDTLRENCDSTPDGDPKDPQWNFSHSPEGQFDGTPHAKSARIDFSQQWRENRVRLKIDVLDSVKAAVKGASDSIGSLVGNLELANVTTIAQSILDALQQIRDGLAPKFREYRVHWRCKFAIDSTADVYVKHTITPRINVELKGQDPNANRMKWSLKVVLTVNGDKAAADVTRNGQGSTGSAPIIYLDPTHGIVTAVQGSDNYVKSDCTIRLDYDGWLDQVKDLLKQLADQANMLKGLLGTGGDQGVLKRTLDGLKAGILSALKDMWDVLSPLLVAWDGSVEIQTSHITIIVPTPEALKRLQQELHACAVKESGESRVALEHFRSQIVTVESGVVIPGSHLLPLSEWDKMGLDPGAYEFHIVRPNIGESSSQPVEKPLPAA